MRLAGRRTAGARRPSLTLRRRRRRRGRRGADRGGARAGHCRPTRATACPKAPRCRR
ncbi:MAG: hypothetical protein MZW92_55435 [Comamonadaceae bacterium]|nr:hypothetical protein [Comamonadaceae bacterium]